MFFIPILQCSLHWLQLSKRFSLSISLRHQHTFFKFVFSARSWPELPQHSILNTLIGYAYLARCYFGQFLTLGWHPTQLTFFVSGYFNTARHFYFECVTFQPTTSFSVLSPTLLLSVRSLFCPSVPTNSFSSWDKWPSNLWTLPAFSELSNITRDSLFLQQQLLRSSFVPTMRRNLSSGSTSSRLSLQRQVSDPKISNMPTLLPACPSKSFRTF